MVSKYGVISGPYFSVFGREKTPYLDTFRAVQISGGTSWLFTTIMWQVIQRVHVVYGSWFSWKHVALFWHWRSSFYPKVAATMNSKRFAKLGIIVYFRILWKIWSKDDSYIIKVWTRWQNRKYLGNPLWTSFLVRVAFLYQTLRGQPQTKLCCSKCDWVLR